MIKKIYHINIFKIHNKHGSGLPIPELNLDITLTKFFRGIYINYS